MGRLADGKSRRCVRRCVMGRLADGTWQEMPRKRRESHGRPGSRIQDPWRPMKNTTRESRQESAKGMCAKANWIVMKNKEGKGRECKR